MEFSAINMEEISPRREKYSSTDTFTSMDFFWEVSSLFTMSSVSEKTFYIDLRLFKIISFLK
jgi:hypothetical protein